MIPAYFTSFNYKMPGCPDKRISLTIFQRENTIHLTETYVFGLHKEIMV